MMRRTLLRRPTASVTQRRHMCDGLKKGWELPFRQIPWALPFRVTREQAHQAFLDWEGVRNRMLGQLNVRVVRPMHVPYYVFVGDLEVNFTGVISYDDLPGVEYARPGISCEPLRLDAGHGRTTAVYAGFDFRRKYVRQALPPDLSEELLEAAVPYTELTGPIFRDLEARRTAGAGVEAFQVKPGFAYVHRIEERLPLLAQQLAQAKLATVLRGEERDCAGLPTPAREPLKFRQVGEGEAPSDPSSYPRCARAGGRSVVPAAEQHNMPAHRRTRVDDVTVEFDGARLHDKGVLVLPLWAVEYDFLGQPFRAFVSALTDATPTPAVSGVHHHPPWVLPAALTGGVLAGGVLGASALGGGLLLSGGGAAVGGAAAMVGAYADAMFQFRRWRALGELRRREEGANVKWKVHRKWIDEVERVLAWQMPAWMRQEEERRKNRRQKRSGAAASNACALGPVTGKDYELLGFRASGRDACAVSVGAAFRAQCLVWHPDTQAAGLCAEEADVCTRRLQQLVEAHARLRRKHGDPIRARDGSAI